MPFKHTPGPHWVDRNFPGDVECDKGTIAVVMSRAYGVHCEPGNELMADIDIYEAQANAALFARAHKLAALLDEVRDGLKVNGDTDGWGGALLTRINDALEGL